MANALLTNGHLNTQPSNGTCRCGCGQRTLIAKRNRFSRGHTKGEPVPYLRGHGHAKSGPDSHKWKGGRWTHKTGYVYICAPEHPAATTRDGYVLEHRLVMERLIGRLLKDGEEIHHRNHRRDDNRPENLALYSSRSEHQRTEHRDNLTIWRDRNKDAAIAAARSAGRQGAAVRWAGHTPPVRQPKYRHRKWSPRTHWSPWSRLV